MNKLCELQQETTAHITCVAFSPDGELVLYGATDCAAYLFEAKTGKFLKRIENPTWIEFASVEDVAFSPDGKSFVVVGHSNMFTLFDAKTFEIKKEFDIAWASFVKFSPDGKYLVAIDMDKFIYVIDVKTAKILHKINIGEEGFNVEWSPDSKKFCTQANETLYMFGDYGDKLLFQKPIDSLTCYSFSPDGKKLAAGSMNGNAYLLDAKTGNVLDKHRKNSSWISDIAFSPDGKTIASSSQHSDIVFWEPETQKIHREHLRKNGDKDCIDRIKYIDGQLYAFSLSRPYSVWTN